MMPNLTWIPATPWMEGWNAFFYILEEYSHIFILGSVLSRLGIVASHDAVFGVTAMLSDRVFCTDNCEALDRMPRQHRSVYKKIPPLAEALPRNQTTIIHHSNVHVSENLKVDKRKNPAVFANVVKSYKRISTCDCRSFYTLHLWSSIQKRLSKCIQRISERVCVHIHICNYWWCRADLHVCMTGRGQRMKQQILWGMTDLRLGF